MNRKTKKLAAIIAVMLALAGVITVPCSAMYNLPVETACEYTDNPSLSETMQALTEEYPSSFCDENGEGIIYGGAEECMAYARWVYDNLFNRMDFYGINIVGGNREYRFDNQTVAKINSPLDMQNEFKSLNLKFGDMIFFSPEVGSNAEHAMIVLGYDNEGATFIHGSWGGEGVICVTHFTWQEMFTCFGQIAWVRTPWEYPSQEFVKVSNISLVGKDTVIIGDKAQFFANTAPDNASYKEVLWSVENITGNAKISNQGELTAYSRGLIKVTATARDGSGLSVSKSVRIAEPSDIVNVTVSSKDINTVMLKWDPCKNVSGYAVYRSDTPNGLYAPIATISGAENAFFADNLPYGTTGYYKIASYTVKNGIYVCGEKCLFVPARATMAPNSVAPRAVAPALETFILN